MMFQSLIRTYRKIRNWIQGNDAHDRLLETIGALQARLISEKKHIHSIHEVEFRVYSQWGDDGIIQWLINTLPELPKRFVEFGVEDYSESNTRFLMVNNNWSGLVIDGSQANIKFLKQRHWFWRHDLTAVCAFLTRDNVDKIIAEWATEKDVGLLHIDVDGNDYWLWDAIESITPSVVIVEYNALFGDSREITIPYDPAFRRFKAHYSGQYFGASLGTLRSLGKRKGYTLVGTNSAGNNAYFVRTDNVSNEIAKLASKNYFDKQIFRDSRDSSGQLNYLSYEQRKEAIRGLSVHNIATGEIEAF